MNTVETSSGREIFAGPSRRGFLEAIGTTLCLVSTYRSASHARLDRQGLRAIQRLPCYRRGYIVTAIIAQPRVVRGTRRDDPGHRCELGAAGRGCDYRFTSERRAEYINPMLTKGSS